MPSTPGRARQALGAGARVGGVEGELQGLDAGGPARRALPGVPVGALDRVDLGLDRLAAGLGPGDLLDQRRLDELGRVAVVASLVRPARRARRAGGSAPRRARSTGAGRLPPARPRPAGTAVPRAPRRSRWRRRWPAPGRRARATPCRSAASAASSAATTSNAGRSVVSSASTAASSSRWLAASLSRLATMSASRSCPRSRSSPRRRSTITAARPRARSRSCSTRTRRSLRSSAPRAVRSAPTAITSVSSRASSAFSADSACAPSSLAAARAVSLVRRRGDVTAGEVHPQGGELADQLAVPPGGLGLPFERAELAADLAQEILHPHQAGFGGVEAALGLLLALAVLEHAGGFLDDRPAILGPGVEHGVDLALADDHVLLAPDPGVGQQLLDVEQAAGHVVDGVLAVTGAEERAADGDLAELDAEQAGRVVDGEADLGPAEGRARGGPGEDHVVHLLAAHGARSLGAEHPRDGVDDVGLARSVGPDDDGDARFELQRRGLGERLETLEGEALQEHGAGDDTGPRSGTGGWSCRGLSGAPAGRTGTSTSSGRSRRPA